jgi:EmrB/QacA subfamily drug resistance transporter
VLAATILGSSIAFIDSTVVNVALPVLQAELGASASELQWIVQSYALLLAALILVGGSLGDHLGRRRVYAAGVALFAVASVACGLAQNVPQLVAARAVQGVGGALLVPGSLALISATFSEEQRGRAIGTWSAFSAITGALGPVIGGWLVENASWRWAFLINAPIAAVVLAILLLRVPESRDESASQSLDWAGAALATLGLGGVVYGLSEAPARGWGDPVTLATVGAGAAALVGFVVWESRARAPMVPLDLFRSRTFSGANLLTLLLYAALGGALYYLPFKLIQVEGYSATAAGAAFLPMILLLFTLSRWSGGLVARYGAKLPLVVGPLIAAAGFALFAALSGRAGYWTSVFPAIVTLGLGMSIAVAPLTTTVMGAVESEHAGVASGVNNAVSRTAGLLAIAVMGVLVSATFGSTLEGRVAAVDAPPALREQVLAQRDRLAGIQIPREAPPGVRAALESAVDQAFVAGFRLVMLVAAGLALASSLVAWWLIEGRRPASEPGAEGARTVRRAAPPAPSTGAAPS